MAAAAAAAAASRRLFCRRSITTGGLRLPTGSLGDEVGAGSPGYRYVHWRTAVRPLGGLRLPAGNEVGVRARFYGYIQGRALSDAARAQVKETGTSSEDLLKLQIEMKYYKNLSWVVLSLLVGFVISQFNVNKEISTLKNDVSNLKADAANRFEGKSLQTHVYYHHCAPTLPSPTEVPVVPSPKNPTNKICPSSS